MHFVNNYSAVEKILHKSAFRSWSSQVSLSNIESRIFNKKLADVEVIKPVFIAALPRAGTTMLLDLCVGTKEFGSHTYRDMPFLLAPILWNRFSKPFKNTARPRERAHKDGMFISADSPEALEEIIWKGFWPSRYKSDRIIPWSDQVFPDFENIFQNHLQKIIFLRSNIGVPRVRYVSKNNLNIARIGYLKHIFPDSTIVVPFRDPLQHSSSLLKQHLNFLEIHKNDVFARKYMEDLGHYDFGKNLRPVDFDNWFSAERRSDSKSLLFWMRYWIFTYRYLIRNYREYANFVSYDSLCSKPEINLTRFGEVIGVSDIDSFAANAGQLTASKPCFEKPSDIPSDIFEQAQALYLELQEASIHDI